MHPQLSYSLAQQRTNDLRAVADRSRIAAQAAPEQPGPAAHLMRRARRAARLARRRLAVAVSVDPRFSGLA